MLAKDFFKFCPHCGSRNFKALGDCHLQCADCNFEYFQNSAAAVIAIITNPNGELLLTRRARDPWAGMLDLPGGFANPAEGIVDSLRREIREELDVEIENIIFVGSRGNRYPYSGLTVHTTDMAFRCTIANNATPKANDDVSELVWLKAGEIDIEQVAGESIKAFVQDFINGTTSF